jgi:hypothetical protein
LQGVNEIIYRNKSVWHLKNTQQMTDYIKKQEIEVNIPDANVLEELNTPTLVPKDTPQALSFCLFSTSNNYDLVLCSML